MKKITTIFIALVLSLTITFINSFAYDCDTDGHVYEITITKKATASSNGERLYSCKFCTHSYSEVIVAGHQWSDWKIHTQATCTTLGKEYRECLRHNSSPHYEYRNTNKNPNNHHYQILETKDSDCDKEGYTLYQCTECKDSYKETTPALKHKYSDWIIEEESTITNEGLRYKVCEYNSTHRIEEVIPQLKNGNTLKKKDNHTLGIVPYTQSNQPTEGAFKLSIYDYTLITLITITTFSFVGLIYYDYQVISWSKRKKETYFESLKREK